jgi:hypothetical protein
VQAAAKYRVPLSAGGVGIPTRHGKLAPSLREMNLARESHKIHVEINQNLVAHQKLTGFEDRVLYQTEVLSAHLGCGGCSNTEIAPRISRSRRYVVTLSSTGPRNPVNGELAGNPHRISGKARDACGLKVHRRKALNIEEVSVPKVLVPFRLDGTHRRRINIEFNPRFPISSLFQFNVLFKTGNSPRTHAIPMCRTLK